MRGIPTRIGTMRDLENLEKELPGEVMIEVLNAIKTPDRSRLALTKKQIKDWIVRIRADSDRAVMEAQSRDALMTQKVVLAGQLSAHQVRAAHLRQVHLGKTRQVRELLDAGVPMAKIEPVKDAEERIGARFQKQVLECCRINSMIAAVDQRLKQMEG